jgi:predicted ribosomally synthesized peptide with nif11-like leader
MERRIIMSMESAVAFYEKLESDKELVTRMQELQTPEAISSYVREDLGYDFTKEEMQKVIFERHPEMSDEELEAVIGGKLDLFSVLVGATAGVGVCTAIVAAAAA